jgi:uncharacterized GH25 family protein
MKRAFLITGLLFVSVARSASAHEFWLTPSSYDAWPGQAIEVRASAGEGFRGEQKVWSSANCVRFVARTDRTIDLTRGGFPGDSIWTRFAPSDKGGAMLAYESGFTPIELRSEKFNRYLEEDGLDGPLAERRRSGWDTPGRERYRRCAKVWLAGGDPSRALTPFGLPLEIIPLVSPGSVAFLPARVLWEGKPLEGALVNAWHTPLRAGRPTATPDSVGIAWSGRTDSHGEVKIPMGQDGEWMVSLVHMVPAVDKSEADWESTWASLTFQRAVGPKPAARASR